MGEQKPHGAQDLRCILFEVYIKPVWRRLSTRWFFVSPDAYYGTRVWVNKSRMVRKIYAVFYLKYISNPFSLDLVQGGFCESRRVCIYASLGEGNSYGAEDLRRNFWLYISNPFSLKIVCKVVFVNPDAYYGTRVWVNKSRIVRKIYAAFYLKYISNPFSVDLVQGGFRKPRRVCIYASLGEEKPHRAEDLRCILFKLYIKPV